MTRMWKQHEKCVLGRLGCVLAMAAIVTVTGCENTGQGVVSGAAIGAGSGAAIGAISGGGAGKGAAIGAIGGAVVGGIIGNQNERNAQTDGY